MACSMESCIEGDGLIWRRLATPREVMLGLHQNLTTRNICTSIEIISSLKITKSTMKKCAEHFNKDMDCFHELLIERPGTNDVWLARRIENNYTLQEVPPEVELDITIMNDQINYASLAGKSRSWKLFYYYAGRDESPRGDYKRYPHIYQLIFVFCTSNLDELSCVMISDMFLNNLDCALKNIPFQSYSPLKLYDIGSKIESNTNRCIEYFQECEKRFKKSTKWYKSIYQSDCSNFNFEKKKVVSNVDSPFQTMRYTFDQYYTLLLLDKCKGRDISFYALIIAIINNALFKYANMNGFEGIFRVKVLHKLNARFIYNKTNYKYTFKIGSYTIPLIQNFKMESEEVDDIFVEARRVEESLEIITEENMFFEQEALREIIIRESCKKINSGRWNPHYCFSLTNLGDLSTFCVPEHHKNSFRTLSYERSSSPQKGGHFDVIFYIFRERLNFCIDYSNEYFTDEEMRVIFNLINSAVEGII